MRVSLYEFATLRYTRVSEITDFYALPKEHVQEYTMKQSANISYIYT